MDSLATEGIAGRVVFHGPILIRREGAAMIEQLTGLHAHTVGFKLSGKPFGR